MKNFEGPYGFTNDKSTIFFFHFNSDQSELTNRVGIGGGGGGLGTDHGIGDHNEILLIGKIFAFYIRVASVLLENLHIKGGCGGGGG